jgi:hypothetical protein
MCAVLTGRLGAYPALHISDLQSNAVKNLSRCELAVSCALEKTNNEVYGSDENLVVTAPTSSGKTAIFELAYLRMRKESPGRMAIYLAPTKVGCHVQARLAKAVADGQALCSERSRDWKHRFDTVGTCEHADIATYGR